MPTRFARRAVGIAVILVVVISFNATAAATNAAGHSTSTSTSSAGVAQGSSLTLHASLANWTWVGSGNPCAGGTGELVANFVANASGGVAPYRYLWNFGDGSPPSDQQSPSHDYSFNVAQYNITVILTDNMGATASAIFTVGEPAFSCPAVLVPSSHAGSSALLIVAIVVGASAAAAIVGIDLIRRQGQPPARR